MGGARRKCEICDIKEKDCGEKLLFAKDPLREHVCKQWVKVVGKEDLVYLPIEKLHDLRYVCGNHFGKRDYTKSKTRLKKHAIPKFGLKRPPLPDELLEGFPLHMARSSQVVIPLEAAKAADVGLGPPAMGPVESTSQDQKFESVPLSGQIAREAVVNPFEVAKNMDVAPMEPVASTSQDQQAQKVMSVPLSGQTDYETGPSKKKNLKTIATVVTSSEVAKNVDFAPMELVASTSQDQQAQKVVSVPLSGQTDCEAAPSKNKNLKILATGMASAQRTKWCDINIYNPKPGEPQIMMLSRKPRST